MNYAEYESSVKAIKQKNSEHLAGFRSWLMEKKLTEKTINGHISNVDFYINYYLTYYDAYEAETGCSSLSGYLGSFFIRKAAWSSIGLIKSNAASIKKFYAYMLEQGLVEERAYRILCEDIKDGMSEWLEAMRRYEEDIEAIDMFDDLLD